VRAGSSARAGARTTAEGASTTVTVLAWRARPAITKAAAITAVATKAATISTVAAEAAAALWGWCGTFKLELRCHCLAAVLGNFEGHALTLAEGLRAGRRQCGDVYEHVRTTTIRKDKSKALGLIEPLYSSSLSHRKPLVLAQVIQ